MRWELADSLTTFTRAGLFLNQPFCKGLDFPTGDLSTLEQFSTKRED